MTTIASATCLAFWCLPALLVSADQQTKPFAYKSQTWEITVVSTTTVKAGNVRKLVVPTGSHLLDIEVTVRYVGPEGEVPAPLLRVVSVGGDEYKPPDGELTFNAETAEGNTMVSYYWLASAVRKTPERKLLKPGVTFSGVIYNVLVPDRERLEALRLGFADIAPFPLKVVP